MELRRALTLVEVLASIAVLAAIAIVLTVLLRSGHRADSLLARDMAAQKQVVLGWITVGQDKGGHRPMLPGAIGRRQPGVGSIDESRNDHDSLYSCMLASGLLNPDVLVSKREPNHRVVVCSSYDFSAYQPAQGVYWDTQNFKVDLATRSNVSWAAIPLDPTPRRARAFTSSGPGLPVLGTRGVKGSATSGPEFERSLAPRLHGNSACWRGFAVYGDCSIAYLDQPWDSTSFDAPGALSLRAPGVDRLFANDTYTLATQDPLRNLDALLVVQKDPAPAGECITESCAHVCWD